MAGDLVDNGWLASDWRDDFFAGAAPLMGQVPLLAVPGTHEAARRSPLAARRSPLAARRSPLAARRSPLSLSFFVPPQNGTAGREEVWWWRDHGRARFVGLDSNLVGSADEQLAWLDSVLADSCGKLSVHFFGHTHGYSRGQSQDHRHLWVDVATAGGRIDPWSDSDSTEYAEMTVTQAEYGFGDRQHEGV